MGINESYSHVRSDILLKEIVPTVNQAYATVIQEETQRLLGVMDVNKEPLTIMVNRKQGFKGRKLYDTACEHCGYKNHLTKDCYRIIGYPIDFKSKRKQGQGDSYGSNTGFKGYGDSQGGNSQTGHRSSNFPHNQQIGSGFRSYANCATTKGQDVGLTLTEEEYNHVINLRHNNTSSASTGDNGDCKANVAGNVSLTSDAYDYSWIIDSGATHHITSSKEMLAELSNMNSQRSNTVQLPTGNKAQIANTGTLKWHGDWDW
ncbi:hypothetical protein KY290_033808 [Solanum tuberosum]|uniref:Retrovirus-related Pol polyprotein from transposon TNT 1-94-like beta-barrel domain-containing protein n=1 Tax=Solanum tuberosum TaxID=4113 RepID=A0ABQ7U518_SOLTU|nr:hypothetical protein KY285_033066 [Solanum tuberosum]KAH0740765.1 hypothetical protein KY290_033808 [Solanum tuberosum]